MTIAKIEEKMRNKETLTENQLDRFLKATKSVAHRIKSNYDEDGTMTDSIWYIEGKYVYPRVYVEGEVF